MGPIGAVIVAGRLKSASSSILGRFKSKDISKTRILMWIPSTWAPE